MIHRLDPETRSKIAAGEVVARPASVVVELIENALDAGAETVEIEVGGDGTDRIRVADDGRGMAESDAALAVERHTASQTTAAGWPSRTPRSRSSDTRRASLRRPTTSKPSRRSASEARRCRASPRPPPASN
ncbi:ATP-binding protein [Haloferax sp. ATCC BAA-646]|uniref:ATP-binding protein n=1 Tax=Haloferax sp. ATCC BAA-646 TaxID=1227464 RepID=UPI0026A86448